MPAPARPRSRPRPSRSCAFSAAAWRVMAPWGTSSARGRAGPLGVGRFLGGGWGGEGAWGDQLGGVRVLGVHAGVPPRLHGGGDLVRLALTDEVRDGGCGHEDLGGDRTAGAARLAD